MASGYFIGQHCSRESRVYEKPREGRIGEEVLTGIVMDCELDPPYYFLRDATKKIEIHLKLVLRAGYFI